MQTTDETIVVTARGMASALGDVITACAAARAGLARPASLGVRLRSPEDGLASDVMGHPAGELTRGFEGFARLLRLAALGFGDLARHAPEEPWSTSGAGVYLSLPDAHRVHTGLAVVPDESSRASRAERARDAAHAGVADMAPRLVRTAAKLAGWSVDPALRFHTTSGHAGMGEALQRAIDDLRRGQVDTAVVGGVDSLVEEETVMWLHATGRLKRLGVPVGLAPGEASAFVVLETGRSARARGAPFLGVIRALRLDDEEEGASLLSGAPARGAALARCLSRAVETAELSRTGSTWVLSDHNGEAYRAAEWGHALARLARTSPALASSTVWYPAASFGDVGAASGAVHLCLAIHAFQRGGAPAPAAVIASSSDGTRRSAFVVSKDESRSPEART